MLVFLQSCRKNLFPEVFNLYFWGMLIRLFILFLCCCSFAKAQINSNINEPLQILAADNSTRVTSSSKQPRLRLYPALVFWGMWLHPKSGSYFEKQTFKHYLNGTSKTFYITTAEFELIASYVKENSQSVVFPVKDSCNSSYYLAKVSLYGLPYFDNSLGMVYMYFDTKTNTPFALYDIFNFNKARIGTRKLKHEIQTRLVNMIQPKRAKEFVICYSCDEAGANQ